MRLAVTPRRFLLRALAVVVVGIACSACRSGPEQWGPFRGQVVDAETGQPIAGANVVVQWLRDPPSLESSTRFYDAQEAVSDADGRFEIPRRTHLLTAWVTAPGLSVFSPGYVIQDEVVTPPGGRVLVDPTVVKMKPLRTREERCEQRPNELWGPSSVAPLFTGAVQQYNIGLKCWRK